MCIVLNIPRSTYYYESKAKEASPDEYSADVIKVFKENRRAYGTRRIKKAIAAQGKVLSRRRIARIMSENGLVSSYTVAKYRVQKTSCNEAKVANVVNRSFNGRNNLEVVVS